MILYESFRYGGPLPLLRQSLSSQREILNKWTTSEIVSSPADLAAGSPTIV